MILLFDSGITLLKSSINCRSDDLGGIVGAVSLDIKDTRDYWEGELTRVMTVFKKNREKSFRLYTTNEAHDRIIQPLELCLWKEWDGQEEWDTDRYKSCQW